MKKVIWICGIAALILVLLAGVFTWTLDRVLKVAQQPVAYTLIRVLANPDDYDGKKVRVRGALKIKDDAAVLYCTNEDWRYDITINAVLLDEQKYEELKAFDNKYIIFNGRFDADETGDEGMYAGTIKDITDIIDTYGGMSVE